jgi:hypothetical protein
MRDAAPPATRIRKEPARQERGGISIREPRLRYKISARSADKSAIRDTMKMNGLARNVDKQHATRRF